MALTGREMRPCWPQKVAVCNKKSVTTKVEIDGKMRFYGDTDLGKFDDYLTAQIKCPLKK